MILIRSFGFTRTRLNWKICFHSFGHPVAESCIENLVQSCRIGSLEFSWIENFFRIPLDLKSRIENLVHIHLDLQSRKVELKTLFGFIWIGSLGLRRIEKFVRILLDLKSQMKKLVQIYSVWSVELRWIENFVRVPSDLKPPIENSGYIHLDMQSWKVELNTSFEVIWIRSLGLSRIQNLIRSYFRFEVMDWVEFIGFLTDLHRSSFSTLSRIVRNRLE